MDHVFLRGSMPPKSRRPLPSTKRIDLNRFYAHRRTLSEMVFLKLILCRLKNRHTALRLPAIRRLRIAATISSSVKSGCSAISRQQKVRVRLQRRDAAPARLGRDASGFVCRAASI